MKRREFVKGALGTTAGALLGSSCSSGDTPLINPGGDGGVPSEASGLEVGVESGLDVSGAESQADSPAEAQGDGAEDAKSDGPPIPYTVPNILIILVDQMRLPQGGAPFQSKDYLPNLTKLREESVSFTNHYVATSPCSPSRACLLTGLYSHQHFILTNVGPSEGPSLDVRFPTYGTFLRKLGYRTAWFGKWHLAPTEVSGTLEDCPPKQPKAFDAYGFGYVGCPQVGGLGHDRDPETVEEFLTWIKAQKGKTGSFCATVSLVNPHDICYFYNQELYGALTDPACDYPFSKNLPVDNPWLQNPPKVFTAVPANFEANLDSKPRLQRARRAGKPISAAVTKIYLDCYLRCHQFLDAQVKKVLDGLKQAGFEGNTIVIFTADHGEYGGAHGLMTKGWTAYQEGIQVPLYIKDPTGQWGGVAGETRAQLTSNVDMVALLLDLATGGNGWRKEPAYAHLAGRAELSRMIGSAVAPGRSFILHTADPGNPSNPPQYQGKTIPSHVIGMLRQEQGLTYPHAKLVTYRFWQDKSVVIQKAGQELEFYDHSTAEGRKELDNLASQASPPTAAIDEYLALLEKAVTEELRAPLADPTLAAASQSAKAKWVVL